MNNKKITKSSALAALSAAAAALPGIATAAIPAEHTSFSFHASNYKEGEVSGSKLASNDTSDGERYDIDVQQFAFEMPIASKFQLNIDAAVESMSGASQRHIRPEDGQLKLVMSGATIDEERTDVAVAVRSFIDNYTVGASIGNSSENDYDSDSYGLNASLETNEKLTTYSVAILRSSDTIEPNDAIGQTAIPSATPGDSFFRGRVKEEDKTTTSFYAGVLQVIDKTSTVETGINLLRHSGYLSDPYKEAYIVDLYNSETNTVGDQVVADRRPDSKKAWSWSTRYRKYLAVPNAALHLDYRFYHDDWEIDSHTLSFDWYQNLPNGWQVVPGVRWYSQSEAGFYAPYYVNGRADYLASSDFRLSGYGALTAQMMVKKTIGDVELFGLVQSYESGDSYGLDSSDEENPALVDFMLLTVGFDYKFK